MEQLVSEKHCLKTSYFLLTFIIPVAFVFLNPSVATGQPPAGYALTFSDEFNTLSLDPNCNVSGSWSTYWCKWNVRHLTGNSDDALKAHPSYTGTGGQSLQQLGLLTHEVTNGILKLYGHKIPTANRPQFHNFPYAAGMISSEKSHAQTYGYWECRMRIPSISKGNHWAMWLLQQDGAWPPEIDMVERIGNDNNTYMNSHGAPNDKMIWFTPNDVNGWHTYGFLWTTTEMIWYFDGVEKKRIANYVSKPMYFLISPEIAGSWAGDPDNTTIWPMLGEIDYVRIYQKSISTGIEETGRLDLTQVYPNPCHASFTLKISSEIILNDAAIKIYDLCGKEVKNVPITDYETVINKEELSNGLYFYSIFNGNEKIGNGKLLVQ